MIFIHFSTEMAVLFAAAPSGTNAYPCSCVTLDKPLTCFRYLISSIRREWCCHMLDQSVWQIKTIWEYLTHSRLSGRSWKSVVMVVFLWRRASRGSRGLHLWPPNPDITAQNLVMVSTEAKESHCKAEHWGSIQWITMTPWLWSRAQTHGDLSWCQNERADAQRPQSKMRKSC